MAFFTSSALVYATILQVSMVMAFILVASAGNFYQDVDITWGGQRAKILNGGQLLTLSLDESSGSGLQSKKEYLFGRFDMQLKLIPGNSAGTVTTFYLSSQGPGHDEIDFEFLGNVSGQPYTIHTNVYAQGKGDREQQFHLCSIQHQPYTLIPLFGTLNASYNIPIRVINNDEAIGVPFPKSQPMRVYGSLWNADDWATQGGRIKTDWSKAPFTVSYRNVNFNGNACVGSSSCAPKSNDSLNGQEWQTQNLDAKGRNRLRWVQQKYMIYNYCADVKRFPQGVPPECKRSRF